MLTDALDLDVTLKWYNSVVGETHTNDTPVLDVTLKPTKQEQQSDNTIISNYITLTDGYDAVKHGNLNLAIQIFSKYDSYHKNTAMTSAIRSGLIESVIYFIEQGVNHWSLGLATSALVGNLTLVEFFLGKDINKVQLDWALGCALSGIGTSGDKRPDYFNIIVLLLDVGADRDKVINYAICKGDTELMSHFIV